MEEGGRIFLPNDLAVNSPSCRVAKAVERGREGEEGTEVGRLVDMVRSISTWV